MTIQINTECPVYEITRHNSITNTNDINAQTFIKSYYHNIIIMYTGYTEIQYNYSENNDRFMNNITCSCFGFYF